MLPLVCIFCSGLTSVVYGFADEPSGFPAVAELLAQYLFASSMALWVQRDVVRRRRTMPYDFDSLVFAVWWVATPIYLFRTRGWRALGPIALFVAVGAIVVLVEGALVLSRSPQPLSR